MLISRVAFALSLAIDHLFCLKIIGLIQLTHSHQSLKDLGYYLRLCMASVRFLRDLYEMSIIFLWNRIMTRKIVARSFEACICIDIIKNILDLLSFSRILKRARHSEFILGVLTLMGTIVYILLIIWPEYRMNPH